VPLHPSARTQSAFRAYGGHDSEHTRGSVRHSHGACFVMACRNVRQDGSGNLPMRRNVLSGVSYLCPTCLSRSFHCLLNGGLLDATSSLPARKQKAPVRKFVIPYTGARAIQNRNYFPSLCTKTEKGSIIGPAMRGEFRGIWRPRLRMQGAECARTLSLHCTSYLPCKTIIILNLPKFN
jgi:hypothetical protein